MGNNKRIAANIVAQILSFAVSLGVNLILSPYITATLGKEMNGFVGLAYTFTSYISVFTVAFNAMLGVFVSTEYYKKNYEQANRYFASVSIINMILSLVLILPFILVVMFMDAPFLPKGVRVDIAPEHVMDIKVLFAIIFATFLLNLAASSTSISLYVKNRLDISAKRNAESVCLRAIILVVSFLCFSPKVYFVGIASAFSTIYIVVTNLYYWRKMTPDLRIQRKYYDRSAVGSLLKVGIWNTVNQMTSVLIGGLDLWLANTLVGRMAMGYINFAQTFPSQMVTLLSMISNAFAPQLTRSYATEGKEQFKKELNSALRVCGFLASVPIIGFIAFGQSFYHLWQPTLTAKEVQTVNILSLMILFHTIFDVFLYPMYTVHSIMKQVKLPTLVSFAVAVMNIILETILIKTTNLGVYAIEIATAILMFSRVAFFTPIYTAYLLKEKWYTFYPILGRGVLSSSIVLVVYLAINQIFDTSSWIRLICVAVFAGAIGYIINYFIILHKEDRIAVKNMIIKKVKRSEKK